MIQRVSRSSVSVDDQQVGDTGVGLVVLVGITHDDTLEDAQFIAEKTINMRVFPPEGAGTGFERSLREAGGGVLLVSQFTLYASTRKGRRPSFTAAAPAPVSEPMFQRVVDAFRDHGVPVSTGVFGAHMVVDIVNDGPVTIMLDSADRLKPRRSAE